MVAEDTIEPVIEDVNLDEPPPEPKTRKRKPPAKPRKPRKPKAPEPSPEVETLPEPITEPVPEIIVETPASDPAPTQLITIPRMTCPAQWSGVITRNPNQKLPRYFHEWASDLYEASGSVRQNSVRNGARFTIFTENGVFDKHDRTLNPIVLEVPPQTYFKAATFLAKARWYRLSLAAIAEAMALTSEYHCAKFWITGNNAQNASGGYIVPIGAQNPSQAAWTCSLIAAHSRAYQTGSIAQAMFFNGYAQMFGATPIPGIDPMFEAMPLSGVMDKYVQD